LRFPWPTYFIGRVIIGFEPLGAQWRDVEIELIGVIISLQDLPNFEDGPV